ncbi:hypothetical protein AZI87_08195 [Bdellovibrio bacteriovorus]|uniref:Lipoprotein n=1 Tax=Bdellovibrio bacteriovorus TaxID=959 RepID=A0A162GXV0_BDEBC|nr:hypothetical protein [Bdellovibrio bacteriovorus]KYG69181.1 hypothetical protein AZI87_08195 [Bdellovibrio bacteriovorus]
MKQFSFLIVSALTITACSGGGGSGSEAPVDQFRPFEKPANAMTAADVTYYTDLNKALIKIVPAPNAIFTSVVSGASAKTVEVEERQKSIEKLSPEGVALLKRIKKECEVFPAFGAQWGDTQIREGSVSGERAQMSIAAKGCPLSFVEEGEAITRVNSVRADKSSQVAEISNQVTLKQKVFSVIQDPKLRESTKVEQYTLELISVGNADVKIEKEKMSMIMKISGAGRVAVKLADGDTVSGPLKLQMSVNSATGEMQMQYLMDLQTLRGALRIVAVASQAQTELYINGEKADPAGFGDAINPKKGLGQAPQAFRKFYSLLK